MCATLRDRIKTAEAEEGAETQSQEAAATAAAALQKSQKQKRALVAADLSARVQESSAALQAELTRCIDNQEFEKCVPLRNRKTVCFLVFFVFLLRARTILDGS